MAGELTNPNDNTAQSLLDLGFLFGFFKVKTTFRHNHHSIVLVYLVISLGANLYLTHFISHWFAISLFLTTVLPFIVVFILSIRDKYFFSSEEHTEIINQQQLTMQGNKEIGTTEVIDGQTLMYKDEEKKEITEPVRQQKQVVLERRKR